MNLRSWWSISLICCLALFMTGCSLTRSGKAKRDAQLAKQTEAQKGVQAEQEGPSVKERKWEIYASDRHMVDYYVDKESVTFPSRTLVRAWRKRVFPPKSPQKEILTLDEVDCNNARYRTLETQGVYWNGTTTAFKVISQWTTVYEGTPDEAFFLDRCKEARHAAP